MRPRWMELTTTVRARQPRTSLRRSPKWLLCLLVLAVAPNTAFAEELPPHILEISRESGRPVFWGTVVDVDGNPIAEAEVRLSSDYRLHPQEDLVRPLVLLSDQEGRFMDFSPADPDHAFIL